MLEKLGYIDVANLAPRITAETYMFITLMDDVCAPSTQFAAYNRITAPKSCELFYEYGHETLHASDEIIYNFFKKL